MGGFELPFIPTGYSPAQVIAAGNAYAASHGYRGPHMVMQEGHIEVRDGVPGIMVKYIDGDGLSTTEWTPLNAAPPPQPKPPAPPPASQVFGPGNQAPPSAPNVASALAARVPDAQNPKALAYAQQRLGQLDRLGVKYEQLGDPTATWRAASQNVLSAAQSRGYDNPRDWLAGRPAPHPIPVPRPQPQAGPTHPVAPRPTPQAGPSHPSFPIPRPNAAPQHPQAPPRPQQRGVREALVAGKKPQAPTRSRRPR